MSINGERVTVPREVVAPMNNRVASELVIEFIPALPPQLPTWPVQTPRARPAVQAPKEATARTNRMLPSSPYVQEYAPSHESEPLLAQLRAEMREAVAGRAHELARSVVYDVKAESNTLNEDTRKSKNLKFDARGGDDESDSTLLYRRLFALVQEVVREVNERNAKAGKMTYEFVALDTDLTYILYEEGDFFHAHEDYLSLTTNMVDEFTGIICLERSADLRGGETLVTEGGVHFNCGLD